MRLHVHIRKHVIGTLQSFQHTYIENTVNAGSVTTCTKPTTKRNKVKMAIEALEIIAFFFAVVSTGASWVFTVLLHIYMSKELEGTFQSIDNKTRDESTENDKLPRKSTILSISKFKITFL